MSYIAKTTSGFAIPKIQQHRRPSADQDLPQHKVFSLNPKQYVMFLNLDMKTASRKMLSKYAK